MPNAVAINYSLVEYMVICKLCRILPFLCWIDQGGPCKQEKSSLDSKSGEELLAVEGMEGGERNRMSYW